MHNMKMVPGLCVVLAVVAVGAFAQNPFVNPSFEDGLDGWSTYEYVAPPNGQGALPEVGSVGPSPNKFDLIPPPQAADGLNVCGLQGVGVTRNGGVCQSFYNPFPQSLISVSARAYSVHEGFLYGYDSRVRAGIAQGITLDRDQVSQFYFCDWGEAWQTITVPVPNVGYQTLFIESLQPDADELTTISTLWDNVRWHIKIIGAPTAQVPGYQGYPDTTARIRWTTDVPSTTRVEYGLTTDYGQEIASSDPVTSHNVVLANLLPANTYHFRVASTAPNCMDVVSGDFTFSMPIRITNVASKFTPDGANVIVSWNTDIPTDSQVEFGETPAYGSATPIDPTPVTEHSVLLTGLDEYQEYHFRVMSAKLLCTTAVSGDYSFKTLPAIKPTLENGSFELPHGEESPSLYPWAQYTDAGSPAIDGIVGPYPKGGPDYWPAPPGTPLFQASDGVYFLGAAATSAFKNGGVFQRIVWPEGRACTLDARYATHRVGGNINDTRVRLGIDPNGGIDPQSASVVWWSGYSPFNDGNWYYGAVTATAGVAGHITLFLDIVQQYALQEHACAVDNVVLAEANPMTIGQLKQSETAMSAVLRNTFVTHVDPDPVSRGGNSYTRVYIEEYDRSAGIAVLFDVNAPDPPSRLDKAREITGTMILHNLEAMFIAQSWSLDRGPYQTDLPGPLAVRQCDLGGGCAKQPALYASRGLCNVGLRVRVWGRINLVSPEGWPGYDAIAYIDDGSGLYDGNQLETGGIVGVRLRLRGNQYAPFRGDYITATGVLSVQFLDPDEWPGTGDEYYAYTVLTSSPDDWQIVAAGQ